MPIPISILSSFNSPALIDEKKFYRPQHEINVDFQTETFPFNIITVIIKHKCCIISIKKMLKDKQRLRRSKVLRLSFFLLPKKKNKTPINFTIEWSR